MLASGPEPFYCQGVVTPSMTKLSRPRRAPARTKSTPAPRPSPLQSLVLTALEDMKAVNIKTMDVRSLTDVTDNVVVASGNSDRHVKSIAERVVQLAKSSGFRPLGVEGAREGEWVLVDLGDVVCHVMLPRTRELFGLEELWDVEASKAPAPVVAVPARDTARALPSKPRASAAGRAAPKPRATRKPSRPRRPQ
jgi:ribosome-associated protein